jgi:hypothetical protein
MNTKRWLGRMMALGVLGLAGACAVDTDGPAEVADGMGQVVPPGKADNFISNTAVEYVIQGVTTVTLEEALADASEEDKLARARELVSLKQIVLGWFLGQYIGEKHHDDSNADYGGYGGLTKNGSYDALELTPVDGLTYQFNFRQEIGGPTDLLHELPTTLGEDGRRHFELIIGKISNDKMAELETNDEWYREPPWSGFDPEEIDPGLLETIDVAIWAEEQSIDGWFDYPQLFDDGRVTIGVHFGWDYHHDYHLVHSEEVYQWLVSSQGFASPVGSYLDYTRTSGPLTKTIDANGQPVVLEISLFWGKPGTDTDPDTDAGGVLLEQDMRQSFREREVIMFSGHSGPFYGFALANWKKTDEGDLDDAEVAGLDMPQDTYQLVIAEGCDTYALGQAFRMNPNKPGSAYMDIVTTTSFSNASTAAAIKDSLNILLGETWEGQHEPTTFKQYLREMDRNASWFDTMYGVHGIDDNPHKHPYGDPTALCGACQHDADCGGVGRSCTRLTGGETFCSYECTADDGCPDGYKCMDIAFGDTLRTHRCAPVSLTCQ